MVFDKTGTLTQDGLEVLGHMAIQDCGDLGSLNSSCRIDFQLALSVCHSLVCLDDSLIGDPLDIEMFTYAKSMNQVTLDSDSVFFNQERIKILKRNEFESRLQRMSVVIQAQNSKKLLVKGSPEVICSMCKEVPKNFGEILSEQTSKGYRVIAFG